MRTAAVTLLALLLSGPADASADPIDYVRDVRPILQKHCYACHGQRQQKSGLRLDVKSEASKGGELYGASIVAGNVAESPLVQFVSDENADLVMPPDGPRLSVAEIATLTQWVQQGAPWPDGVDLAQAEDRRDHWSFRPLAHPSVPQPAHPSEEANWARGAVDQFVFAKLKAEGLRPSIEADRITWLRRVSFDLVGLPPTPDQVQSFLHDRRRDAYDRVVDELLTSPRYGERWGQHWLDVVRYADTHGFEVNTERPHAWPYRDYVIQAFNQDTPYDRFIREQIVGDALGEDAATGFLVTASVLLPGQIGKDDASIRLARQDALDEIVVNISQTFLGLSMGCARCHDHRFDPISQRDYYAMQAMVAGVEYGDRQLPAADADEGPPQAQAIDRKPLEAQQAEQDTPQLVFAGQFRQPDAIHLLRRGDPEQPQDEVLPAVPHAVGDLQLPRESDERQRRRALADWIASPNHPLTARVMVNRIWQGHFGVGLVETPNDFGRNGVQPSHPDLLEWLASEFIRSGWSIKQMHRMIVLSATYRQSARDDATAAAQDADVRLLWRYPTRRLEAEVIRDSMLAISGELRLAMYGRGYDLFDQRGGLRGFDPVESFPAADLRRMIYAHKVRRERDAVFGAFDCPDGGQSAPRRRESTTPIQALNLLNSTFTLERSEAFARRVRRDAGDANRRQVQAAYLIALNRDPTADEISDAQTVLREHGLLPLCRALLNCNEFLFLP